MRGVGVLRWVCGYSPHNPAGFCGVGGRDAGHSVVGVHALLAAVPGCHHLRRVSTEQTRPGQLQTNSTTFAFHATS